MVRLVLLVRPVEGASIVAERKKVWSDGTTTQTWIPFAEMEDIDVEDVGEVRATTELAGDSGDVQVQPGYQVSTDGITWTSGGAGAASGTFATFGTELTAEGIDYGRTFTTFNPSEKRPKVRFGVAVRNGSAGKAETGSVTLRIDYRRTS